MPFDKRAMTKTLGESRAVPIARRRLLPSPGVAKREPINRVELPDVSRRLTTLPPDKGIALWSGRMDLEREGQTLPGRGQAQFTFRPSPRVRYVYATRADSPDLAHFHFQAASPRLPTIDIPPIPGRGRLWTGSSPGEGYSYSTHGILPLTVLGDGSRLACLLVGCNDRSYIRQRGILAVWLR